MPDSLRRHALPAQRTARPATLRAVGYVRSERFWDEKARENALYFVDNELDYDNPDTDGFWRRGEDVVDQMVDSVGLSIAPNGISYVAVGFFMSDSNATRSIGLSVWSVPIFCQSQSTSHSI